MERQIPPDPDEKLSLRAASVIMGLFSLYSLIVRLANFLQGTPDLFVWEFEGLILYLPTALLLGVMLYERRRVPSDLG